MIHPDELQRLEGRARRVFWASSAILLLMLGVVTFRFVTTVRQVSAASPARTCPEVAAR